MSHIDDSQCFEITNNYGLEVCHYTKARISAMHYVVTSCFGKKTPHQRRLSMIVCTILTVQQSWTHLLLENVILNRYAQSDNVGYYARFLLFNLD